MGRTTRTDKLCAPRSSSGDSVTCQALHSRWRIIPAPEEMPLIESSFDSTRAVLTLTFNNERKRNAWTVPLMEELKEHLESAAANEDVQGVVITGKGTYYSAGVDLSSLIKPTNPSKLVTDIRDKNEQLFGMFIDFPKPLAAAVNGPAIGAAVTSLLLMDRVVASSNATFSVPFAKLGVPSEGCSTVTFQERIGQAVANRMLGEDNWVPTASEALEVGLIDEIVGEDQATLVERAAAIVHNRVVNGDGRRFDDGELLRLRRVNAEESANVANSLVSKTFLDAMYKFNMKRNKPLVSMFFWLAKLTLPLWKPAAVMSRDIEVRLVRQMLHRSNA